MQGFQPLESPSPLVDPDSDDILCVSETAALGALRKLNANKSSRPDVLPNWRLRDFAHILAQPLTSLVNCSFADQQLHQFWRLADVVPLPKQQPVEYVSKHLRPISLIPSISKLVEDFVVARTSARRSPYRPWSVWRNSQAFYYPGLIVYDPPLVYSD